MPDNLDDDGSGHLAPVGKPSVPRIVISPPLHHVSEKSQPIVSPLELPASSDLSSGSSSNAKTAQSQEPDSSVLRLYEVQRIGSGTGVMFTHAASHADEDSSSSIGETLPERFFVINYGKHLRVIKARKVDKLAEPLFAAAYKCADLLY